MAKPHQPRTKAVALLVAAGLASSAVAVPLGGADPGPPIPDYRYVLVQPDRAAAELERVGQGAARAIARGEFEVLYRRARDLEAGRHRPQLLVAAYRARLIDNHLAGEARWTVRKPKTGTDLLPFEPWTTAIRSARWSDGRAGRIGRFASGGGSQLMVESPGDSSLEMNWSARGSIEPAGYRFDLRFPFCAVSTLELDVPADREVRLSGGGTIVSGPIGAADQQRRIWRIAFDGDNLGELRLAPADKPEPLVLATLDSQQTVQPGQTQCEFRFDVEVVHGPLKSLTFDCSPGFVPTEVVVRNMARWTMTPSRTPQFVVNWHEPFSGGSLVVRGFSVQRRAADWISPLVAPIGGVVPSERLTIQAGPAVRLENVRVGAFRLAGGTAAADRGQVIVASAGPVQSGVGRIRARVQPVPELIRQHERAWWQADDDPPRATLQWIVEPRSGVINQSMWIAPPGWTVSAIQSTPADLLAAWRVVPDADFGQVLAIDWARALQSGRPAAVTVRLKQVHTEGEATRIWPNFRPMAPTHRTGILALRPHRGWKLAGIAEASTDLAADDKAAVPADMPQPDFVVPIPGIENRSALDFESSPHHLTANVACQIELAPDSAQTTCRLALDAGDRPIGAIALHGCDPCLAGFTWEDASDQSAIRCSGTPSLETLAAAVAGAAGAPWPSIAGLAGCPNRAMLLHLSRPVAGRIELIGRGTIGLPANGTSAPSIAAFAVTGSRATPWTVTVDRRAAPMWRARPGNADSNWTERDTNGVTGFRLMGGADAIALEPVRTPRLLDPWLDVDATQPHCVVYRTRADVVQWNQRTLVASLPAGVENVSVSIDGRSAPRLQLDTTGDGRGNLTIPAPALAKWQLEIAFTVPRSRGLLFERLPDLRPALPALMEPLAVQVSLPTVWTPLGVGWRLARSDAESMNIWLADAGALTSETIAVTVVQKPAALSILLAMSASWVLAGLSGCRWVRPMSVLAAVVLAAAIAWWDSPSMPLLLVLFGAFIVSLIVPPIPALAHSAGIGGARLLQPAGIIALATAIGLGSLGLAAPPSVLLIPVVPDPSGQSDRDTVLAPRDLYESLRATIQRHEPADTGTVVDVHVDGRTEAGSAEFSVRMRVYCHGDSTRFAIPWRGSALSSVSVDGVPGFPTIERDAVIVPIRGRGLHDIDVSFSVPIQQHEIQSVRFPIIESPVCRLTFRAPNGSTNLQVLPCRGETVVSADGDHPRIDADLGLVKSVHLKWLAPGREPPPPFQAREAYLWDISETGARLLGQLECTVQRPCTAVELDLPPGIEVYSVRAEPVARADADDVPPWLARWVVLADESARRLRLEFSGPIIGGWMVHCEFRPTTPLTATGLLAFPSIRDARAAPALCAWRSDGVAVTVAASPDFRAAAIDALQQLVVPAARWELAVRPPARAFLRKRADSAAAFTIRPNPGRLNGDCTLTWTVGPAAADFEWAGTIRSTTDRANLLEWDVPADVAVKDVRGDDVALWNRTGTRLQLWLRKPVAETNVTWTGSQTRPRDDQFELPAVRWLRAVGVTTVRLTAQPGLSLAPVEVQRLEAAADTGRGGRIWEYCVAGANPRARFQVLDAIGMTDFQLRTTVDRGNAGFQAVTRIDATMRGGSLRSVALRAEFVSEMEFLLSAPGATVTEGRREPNARHWFVDYPHEMRGSLHIEVRAAGGAQAGRTWTVPAISVIADSSGRWTASQSLTVVRDRLVIIESKGLTTADGHSFAGSRPWRLIVADAVDPTPVRPPRIRFVEHTAAYDGQSWIRTLTARMENATDSNLVVKWAEPVEVLLAELDGAVCVPGSQCVDRLSLPRGRDGPGVLRIDWRSPRDQSQPVVALPDVLTKSGPCRPDETLLTVVPALPDANVRGTPLSAGDAAARRQSAGVSGDSLPRRFVGRPSRTWIIDSPADWPAEQFTATAPAVGRWWRVIAILSIAALTWLGGWLTPAAPRWRPAAAMALCGWLAMGSAIWLAVAAAFGVFGLALAAMRRWRWVRPAVSRAI